MPWTMENYPDSLKNFDKPIRKKTIEIANAMIDDGYNERDALPIATKQAKEWIENASKKEIEDFNQNGQVLPAKTRVKHSSPSLTNRNQKVVKHDNGWAVIADGAKQASDVFSDKQRAIKRANEIAENKGTKVTIID
ncbi:hypothetical protein JCM19046_4585 [Bacillus sp. JCM 19046]|nr:hypothetical protein JCM19045_3110 [Bacillus sp. JCM 19045]GAF19896.1 hypothetical protein JCM19046_4585 [Bacillus sp. JCM 19046]